MQMLLLIQTLKEFILIVVFKVFYKLTRILIINFVGNFIEICIYSFDGLKFCDQLSLLRAFTAQVVVLVPQMTSADGDFYFCFRVIDARE
jgi:hypothetical protein